MGLLEIEGFVKHIEVRGDKLLTLGVNDVNDRKVAMIMFDVSDPSAPVELDRAIAGQDWTWTSANHDLDTFRVVDELGLAMLPISSSSWDDDGYHYKNWLQMFSFDFETGDVGTRGEIANVGRFRRAFPVEDRIVTFSDQRLKTVDVANPDAPSITANLELAKNVVDFTTVGPFGVMAVADGDWSNEMVELRVVSLHDPDNSQALATVDLGLPQGKLFKLDEQHLAYIATDPVAGDTVVSTINFTDPLEPEVLGTFKSPELGFNRWGSRIFWSAAPTADIAQVGDAVAMFTWPDKGENKGAKLRVVSFENRAFPHESAVVDLGTGTLVDMRSEGSKLYVTTYEPVATDIELDDHLLGTSDPTSDAATASSLLPGGLIDPFPFRQGRVAYYLRIVDLADPNAPKVSDAINVPGKFVGTSTIGSGDFATTVIYTTDAIPAAGNVAAIDTLMLIGDEKARLLDVYGLPSGAGEVHTRGSKAYMSSSGWWSGPFFLEGASNSTFQPSFELKVLDLGRPDTIEQAGAIDIDGATYGNLGEVKGDLAFISGGWSSLFVYDVSDPAAMERVGKFHTLGWWSGKLHASDDGRVYLPAGLYGLHVVDVN
jgi:hypothetical protein